MIARRRHTRALLAGATIFAGTVLAGCAQIPASENVSSCAPADSVQTQREGGGSGPVINGDGVAEFTFAISSSDGTEIYPETSLQQDAQGNAAPVNVGILDDYGMVGVKDALQCAQGGETITATMQMQQIFSPDQFQLTEAQLQQEATVTLKVNRVYHSAATGSIAPQHNGIPAVVTAPDGTPGVTMPSEVAPTELRSATTIQGSGPKLAAGDTVTMNFSAFEWTSGSTISTTWGGQGPVQTTVGDTDDGMFGATAELQGIEVGSQRVVVLPASTVAAYTADGQVPVGSGDAIVVVMDVLGSTPAAQ